jgi:translation initiation factor 1
MVIYTPFSCFKANSNRKAQKGVITESIIGNMTDNLCGGLPPEICEQLNKEEQFIKVKLEKRRYGKEVTVIEGISDSDAELKKIASELKSRLAAGGTVKNGRIEIQGDHREKVKELLVKLGFPESNIVVIE